MTKPGHDVVARQFEAVGFAPEGQILHRREAGIQKGGVAQIAHAGLIGHLGRARAGARKPRMMRIRVLLPAPLPPTSSETLPAAKAQLMSLNTTLTP